MNTLSKNPFNTGSPARGEGFLGRQKIIRNIISFLRKKSQFNLLIFGQRRIGKTSLLRKLQDDPGILGEIALPVYFNLQDKASIELHKLLFEIAARIVSDLDLKIDLKVEAIKNSNFLFYFQNNFIPLVVERLPEHKQLLLLFDEFDVLGAAEDVEDDSIVDTYASRQFISFTANLIEEMQAKEYPIKFIFAVGRNYRDLEPKRFGQIMKFGPQEELSYFSKQETFELLKSADSCIPFDDKAMEEIYLLTSGHPYFSQCLASVSFDAAEKQKADCVTRDIVRQQLINSIKSYSSGIYWIWDSLTTRHQIILYLMAVLKEEKRPLTMETIREKAGFLNVAPVLEDLPQIINKLKTFKFIKDYKQGEYVFYVEFIRKWIVREVSESEIAKLLDQIDEEIGFHLNNARYFFKKKDYKQAVQHYDDILKKTPYHFEALFYTARCYKNLRDEDIKYLDKALGFYKKSYELNRHKAKKEYLYLLFEKLKYLEENIQVENQFELEGNETEKILKEIQKVDPGDSKVTEKLVEIYILKNKDISEIEHLANVEELNLRNKHLKQVSEDIVLLENLRKLDLRNNEIVRLPFQLTQLKNIEELLITGNPINIPDNIIKGPVEEILNYIMLNSGYKNDLNIIKQLEKEIGKKLGWIPLNDIGDRIATGFAVDDNGYVKGLSICNLKLTHVPSLISKFQRLEKLDLSGNQLSDISSLKELKGLQILYLSENQITDITSLKKLKNLKELTLMKNKISHFPAEFLDLGMEIKWEYEPPLEGIFLDCNPLESPPIEIVKQKTEAIWRYFKSLEGKKRVLSEVKVLLVGDGGGGRTSLVKRLQGKAFDKNEPQTHGINISSWYVMDDKTHIKVHFWDFGGQEIMHATHQFFLSKRSLYILVLDGRKDEKTEYWLKHVKSFGGDSPVLVVINKIDENPGFDVNRLFLQEKYINIRGFFRVSCATGEGIENFSQKLIEELSKVEHIHTTWVETWFNVKTKLEKMKNDFISYDDYITLCQEEKITEKISQDTLLDFLHDLGVVLHFKDFKLQETQVLNPEWATTAVYKIINSKEIAGSKGLLKLSRLEKILKQEKDTDYYYPRDKYRYIIDLMQKFELCFEIDSETILIPDLLEIREPSFDFDYTTALKFLIQYDFLPRSIMSRFMVKMHKDIKNGLNWRTGVVLENESFNSTAVVKSDNEEKGIYIYVQGEQKRDYFAAILHTLRVINDSFEKLEAVEKIPIPDDPNITASYKHLILLEKRGIDKFIPDGSEKEYNVKQLLGTIDKDMYGQLLVELKNEFLELSKLEPKKKSFEFERFLNRLFQLFNLAPKDSFRNIGEQIDGSFQMGSDTYLVEAKWRNDKTGQADLLVFDEKVFLKAKWTRGLFISISGFTDNGLAAFSKGRHTSIIGMDGNDLKAILDRKFTLPEAIALKSRYAAETNEFFCPLPELKKRYAEK